MHRVGVISSSKLLWVLRSEAISGHGRLSALVAPSFASTQMTSIHLASQNNAVFVSNVEPSFFKRMIRKIKVFDSQYYKRKRDGYMLYENIANTINYSNFFTDFKLPDTFCSWFIITELHVWMLMIRFMGEGKDGQDVRNSIVEAMWADVNKRKSQLEKANVLALKTQIEELSHQFNAAIIGYDEGIMSDDKVLAASLWRRFFQCECNNPELVEKLVHYVRKQVHELDKYRSDEIMNLKTIPWINHRNL